MAAFKVRKLWTVFITAFFALLASLGLTAPAAASGGAVQQPAEQPVTPAPGVAQHTSDDRAPDDRAHRAPAPRSKPRDRSLPPTIKQRIQAEAHGSSPSVRHLPADLPADDDMARHVAREAEARETARDSGAVADAVPAAA